MTLKYIAVVRTPAGNIWEKKFDTEEALKKWISGIEKQVIFTKIEGDDWDECLSSLINY